MNKIPSIVFFGTPEFAETVLKKLYQSEVPIKAVVTAPDKPAGRGRKVQISDVKKFAIENGLYVLQPQNLKDQAFIDTIKTLNADIFVVVAFRMLPRLVWEMPPLGCFNLHASLLPQYRGAAPINHVIINGELKTGITSFFINDKIDEGDVLLKKEVDIPIGANAGDLHDVLMHIAADLALQTIDIISKGCYKPIKQDISNKEELKFAPKLSKQFCKINWNSSSDQVNNFIHGLSPYPGAYTYIKNADNEKKQLKIFKSETIKENHSFIAGTLFCDDKSILKIYCKTGCIKVIELQLEGKRKMYIEDFLRGHDMNNFKII